MDAPSLTYCVFAVSTLFEHAICGRAIFGQSLTRLRRLLKVSQRRLQAFLQRHAWLPAQYGFGPRDVRPAALRIIRHALGLGIYIFDLALAPGRRQPARLRQTR